jgi:GTPase SAR1 family protein
MQSLQQLRIGGTPLSALFQQDTTEPRQLLAHLEVIEREAQAFPAVKVLILGDQGVGKTSVAKGLSHLAKRSQQSTEGDKALTITECTYESDKFRVPPRLSFWDFGLTGNDALSLTTSFFITERTLYLLVFSMHDCAFVLVFFPLISFRVRGTG